MIIRNTILVLFLIALIFGCKGNSSQQRLAKIVDTTQARSEMTEEQKRILIVQRSLAVLNNSNPDSLAQTAIKKDSIYFICVHGYTYEVPGINDYEKNYKNIVPLKVIPGTSDAIMTKDDEELAIVANKYATRFNKIILNHLNK